MGQSAGEIKSESAKQRTRADMEDIYCMFDETMEAVRSSRMMEEGEGKTKGCRIRNLDAVLEQLLGCFTAKVGYGWAQDIALMFKKHFRDRFEEMWPINKEQFYKLVLSHCVFQTLDLRQELEEMALNMDIHNLGQCRMSYERYFYEVGAARMEQRLPSSFIGQDLPWEESFHQPSEQEAQFNLTAINQTIINHEQEILQEGPQHHTDPDFLPLFIHSTTAPKVSRSAGRQEETLRVQNASIISPETVFFERLTQEKKTEISDLVKFYRQFANALQQMFFSSTSMVSAPYKHFLSHLDQKIKRKNIRSTRKQTLLFADTSEGRIYRQRRNFNTKLLITEIKEFAQAYTDFVWMFLELNQIGESRLGKLLNIYTLYGIVVKSVWKFVEWIGDRGCEYEERKIEDYYRNRQPPKSPLPAFHKEALLPLLRALQGEKNPQKYFKKIVVFYREANKLCESADDLLLLYEELLVRLVQQGKARDIALFRMPMLIESLLKLEEALSSAGEISYSWTSWYVVIEMLRKRVDCQDPVAQPSRLETEPDFEEVVLEE